LDGPVEERLEFLPRSVVEQEQAPVCQDVARVTNKGLYRAAPSPGSANVPPASTPETTPAVVASSRKSAAVLAQEHP